MKRLFIILSVCLCLSAGAQVTSNKGTDFWVGYMGHIDGTSSNMSLYLTSDISTTGTVSIPGKSWSTNFNVTANTVTIVSIPQNLAYMSCSDCILDQGIHVVSNSDIVVYAHIYSNARSDATLVLPTETAGRDYYTMSYTQSTTGNGRENEFMIVGLEDSTVVDITPVNSLLANAHAGGVTYSKTLMQGEVYQAQSDYDLTGTKISSSSNSGTSCKRIAVFSGSSWTALGCTGASSGDNLFQQMYPISAWGKTFITAPWKTRTGGDVFRVLASVDSTNVTINGWNTQMVMQGNYYEWKNDSALYVTADKPVMLAEFMRTQNCDNVTGDPSMVILNPVEQQLNDITLYSSPYQNITGNYINILMESDDTSNFYLDGAKVTWKAVPKNTTYAYSQNTVSSGNHHLNADSGFNAIAYGFGNVESYGYSAGANITNLVQSISLKYKTSAATCKNVPIAFLGNCIYTPLKWKWSFGDGGIDSVQNPTHTYTDTGTFIASLVTLKSNGNDCNSQDSTIYKVKVYHVPTAKFVYSTACSNDTVKFYDSSTIASNSIIYYTWKFGDGHTSTSANTKNMYAAAGSYQVLHTVTGPGNCATTDTQQVTVNQSPKVNFNFPSKCFPDSVALYDSSTIGGLMKSAYTCYQGIIDWGDTSKKDTIYNRIGGLTLKHLYKYANTYTVKMSGHDCVSGCKDSMSQTLKLYSLPVPKCTFSNACQKDTAYITDSSYMTYGSIQSWTYYFGDGTSIVYASNPGTIKHVYTNSGTYTISVVAKNANGCSDSATKSITIYPKPTPSFTATGSCYPDPVLFVNTSTISSGSIVSKVIYYGDGNTASASSDTISYTYSSYGTYTAKLLLTSDKGCKDSATHSVVVSPKPQAVFTLNNGCQEDSIGFTDNSTVAAGSFTSRYWDFGNGDTVTYPGTKTSGKKLYANSGTYTVTLVVTAANICKDTTSKSITIYPKPQATIYANDQCKKDTVLFYDTGSVGYGSITQSKWYWGNGDSLIYNNQVSPQKKAYTAAGNYTVKLVSISNHTCRDTASINLTIYELPQAAFNSQHYCINDSVTYTDLSTTASGTISTWKWYMGDGNIYTQTDSLPFRHHYVSIGQKKISLVVTSSLGCKDSISKSITIDTIPFANFTNTIGCPYDSIIFFNHSSISSGSITQYMWTWPDNSQTSKTDTSKTIHLFSSGSYQQVQLVATSNKGCTDTSLQNVYIWPQPAVAAIMPNSCYKDSVHFEDMTTNDSGSSVQWWWNLGDGNTSSTPNPAHKYAGVGNYQVQLIVRNSWNCYDTLSKVFTVNSGPAAAIYWDVACKNDSVQLVDSTYMAFGSAYKWHWDFGDGDTSNLQNPLHLYPDTGIYTVKMFVQSGNLCQDSTTTTIHVRPNPKSIFSATPVCPYDSASVNATSSNIAYGNITQYRWDFGDGDTLQLYSSSLAKHLYATYGNYTVTLVTTSNYRCKDTARNAETIYPQAVSGFFTYNRCQYDSIHLTDTSQIPSGSINQWNWNFGDGQTFQQNGWSPLSHQYSTAGNYIISLITTTDHFCKDTISSGVFIHPVPHAGFAINNSCYGDTADVADTSSLAYGSIYSWTWWRGDTSQSFTQYSSGGFSYIYSTYGTYPVKLLIQSDSGCVDSIIQNLAVYPLPIPGFHINNTCLSDSAMATDSTHIPYGSVSSRTWNFGDGSAPIIYNNANSVSHLYTQDGIYQVTLIAISGLGCSDSITKNITIYPLPLAAFHAADVCDHDSVTFTDSSKVVGSSLVAWNWSFGDGKSLNKTDNNLFRHYYLFPGIYTARLIASSVYQCKDTTYDTLIVHPLPVANFTGTGNCQHDSALFVNHTSISFDKVNSLIWSFGDGIPLYTTTPTDSIWHHYNLYGNYIVSQYAISSFGCSDTAINSITVDPSPKPWFFAGPVCFHDTSHFIQKSTIPAGTIDQWDWDLGDGTMFSSVSDTPGFDHLYLNPNDYTVTLKVISDKGCNDFFEQTVIVHPLPQVHIGIHPPEGCVPLTTVLTDESTLARDSIIHRMWYAGDGTYAADSDSIVNVYTNPGMYVPVLVVTSDAGCMDSAASADTIKVHELPIASYKVAPDSMSFFRPFTGFTNTSLGATRYRWSFGDLSPIDSSFNSKHIYTDTGRYITSLVAINQYGCSDTAWHPVFVAPDYTFYIPNSFTPNDDGLNDVFMPSGIYKGIRSYEISIYNRWGELVFHNLQPTPPVADNMNAAWDGTFRGAACQGDVYLYRIDLVDYFYHKHNFTGDIHLLR